MFSDIITCPLTIQTPLTAQATLCCGARKPWSGSARLALNQSGEFETYDFESARIRFLSSTYFIFLISTKKDLVVSKDLTEPLNEWDGRASQLQQLATAYGQTFPLTDELPVRRIGDGELADTAKELQKFSGDFQKVLKNSTSKIPELEEPVKAGVNDLKFMATTSKTLGSRIRSGKPASAEARQLMDAVQRVETLVYMDNIPEAVATQRNTGNSAARKNAQAFGLARPN